MKYYLNYLFLFIPPYALGDGLLDLASNQLQADVYETIGQDTYENPLQWKLMGRNVIYMACETVLFFILNIVIEYRWIGKLRR